MMIGFGLALLLAAAGGCAAWSIEIGSRPVDAPPLHPALTSTWIPSPLSLKADRRTSSPPQELTQIGYEVDLGLPNRHAGQNYPDAFLEPANSGSGAAEFADCAFMMYRFVVPSFNEDFRIHALLSGGAEPDPGTLFVGTANWSTNRWDWHLWQEEIAVGDLPSYKRESDGQILVAFLQSAGDPLLVSSVALGERYHIRAFIFSDAFGESFPVGSEITFFAGAYYSGDIEKVEWDFNGDGTSEEDLGSSGLNQNISHVFDSEGVFNVTLRVTGNDGQGGPSETDTESQQFIIGAAI
jgi:hypothetical protein